MNSYSYSTQREIDLIELELSLEKDLDILFETGFNQYGRALCWKKHPNNSYKTQCVINLQGELLYQSDSFLNRYEKAQYLEKQEQPYADVLKTLSLNTEYTDIQPFYFGYAVVRVINAFSNVGAQDRANIMASTNEYNYIDVNGKLLFKKGFLEAKNFTGKVFPIQSASDREYYLLKINQEKLHYQQPYDFESSIHGFFIDKNFLLVNELDQQFTDTCTTLIFTNNHELAFVEYGSDSSDTKVFFLDSNGQRHINQELSKKLSSFNNSQASHTEFSSGIITRVIDDIGVIHINLEGTLLNSIPFELSGSNIYHESSEIFKFSQGFAVVKTNQGYNYINQRGEFLLEKYMSLAWPFSSGVAVVCNKKGNYFLINRLGNPICKIAINELIEVEVAVGRIILTLQDEEEITIIDLDGKVICENAEDFFYEIDEFYISSEEEDFNWWGEEEDFDWLDEEIED
ncbi:MAG: hypothetical protein KC646_00795 [Candidatus Cloacimonetes bacterium]|nr:hypothetical protein [Candidatus Cloacimonadota bacterium]